MKLAKSLLNILFVVAAAFGASRTQPAARPSPASQELAKCWTYTDSKSFFSRLSADDELVYIAADAGRLIALDARTGAASWSTDLGGEIVSNVAAAGKVVAVVARQRAAAGETPLSQLRFLSRETGLPVGSYDVVAASTDVWLIASGGAVVVATRAGELTAFEPGKGGSIWRFSVSGGLTAEPVALGDSIFVATGEKKILTVKAATGETTRSLATPEAATAIGAPDPGSVGLGDGRGMIRRFNLTDGRTQWKFRAGAKIGAIDARGDRLIVTSYDNFVYSIGQTSGHVAWKKRMSARIVAVTPLRDDLIAAFAQDAPSASVISTRNGRVESQFILPAPAVAAISARGSIVVLTETEASGYALGACQK